MTSGTAAVPGRLTIEPRFHPTLGRAEFAALLRPPTDAVSRFEAAFADAFGASAAVAFPYGRVAQWAFLRALGIDDAEVIMPAYTCSVVAHAVVLSGNHPRFVDISLDDYNMDLTRAEAAVNARTRAIIATHTFGYPQDIDRLDAIAQQASLRYGHRVWLIQDCSHAFGATWRGRAVGTVGDVAIYAFNISKILTAIFGGMLTFQDAALARRVRAWRDQHLAPASWHKGIQRRLYLLGAAAAFHPTLYGLTWWLQERTPLLDRLTRSYHLDEAIRFPPDALQQMAPVEAAVGMAQLARYDAIIARRRRRAVWYNHHLESPEGWVKPPLRDGATYSHYVVRVPDRRRVVAEYAARGVHLGELIQYSIPELAAYAAYRVECPNAVLASRATVNFSVS